MNFDKSIVKRKAEELILLCGGMFVSNKKRIERAKAIVEIIIIPTQDEPDILF